jgi:transaldolase
MHIVEAARWRRRLHVPRAVIEACFKHPLTDIGLEKFLKDWEKAQGAKSRAYAPIRSPR